MGAPSPENEVQRLAALHRYAILDSLPEEAFDRIAHIAAEVLDVPVAVNLIDAERQWGKASIGLEDRELPRDASFCAWTILEGEVLVVPDAPSDPRFANNPLVTSDPHIHMYAGAPLITPDGFRVGTLCVTDDKPHAFEEREKRILTRLAAMVVDELELRRQARELEREARAREQLVLDLRRAKEYAETLLAVSSLLDLDLEPEALVREAAQHVARALGVDWGGLVTYDAEHAALHEVWASDADVDAFRCLSTHGLPRGSGAIWTVLNQRQSLYLDDYAAHPLALDAFVRAGVRSAAGGYLGRVGPRAYAFLAVRLREPRAWTDAQRSLFDSAARSVAFALERREYLLHLERAALTDQLTGLGNRRAFDLDLDATLARAARAHTAFSVAVVDLDGLKAVNDTQGHERGDALLRGFADALRAELRAVDRVYRLGGDEYALLLEHTEQPYTVAGIEAAVSGHVERAARRVRLAGFPLIGASLGLALYPLDSRSGADLVRQADERMYARKRAVHDGRANLLRR